MSYSSITIIGTLCSSTILLIIWGIFRKWPKELLKLFSTTWILSWIGYLIFEIVNTQLVEAAIQFQVGGAFFIMIVYACLIILLAIRYKWTEIIIMSLIIASGIALIGYLVIIVFFPPVYVVLITMVIMWPILYWLAKARMGL